MRKHGRRSRTERRRVAVLCGASALASLMLISLLDRAVEGLSDLRALNAAPTRASVIEEAWLMGYQAALWSQRELRAPEPLASHPPTDEPPDALRSVALLGPHASGALRP